MVNLRNYFLFAITGLLIVMLSTGQVLKAAEPSIATAKETESSTVEDGGSGEYKAIQVGDSSLATHTIYRPKDLSVFGENNKLPILAWGNGGCSNSNSMHQNYLSEIASHGFLVIAIGPYQPGGQRGGRGGGMMGGMRAPGGMPGGPMGAMQDDAAGGTRRGPGAGMPGGMRGGAAGGARGGARGGGGMGSSTQSSQLLDAINWAIAQNSDKDSIYYNKIDVSKIAVAGHSCGGLQALEVSTDPRITTTLVVDSGILNTGGGAPGGRGNIRGGGMPGGPMGAIQPDAAGGTRRGAGAGMPGGMPGGMRGGGGARGGAGGGMMGMPALTKEHLAKLHGPVLYLLGGESDIAYANGMDDFKRIEKIPAFVASQGVGHGGTFTQPHGGDWAMVSSAWLKWQLKGDKEAGKLFTGDPCGLAQDKKWTVEKKNIP